MTAAPPLSEFLMVPSISAVRKTHTGHQQFPEAEYQVFCESCRICKIDSKQLFTVQSPYLQLMLDLSIIYISILNFNVNVHIIINMSVCLISAEYMCVCIKQV